MILLRRIQQHSYLQSKKWKRIRRRWITTQQRYFTTTDPSTISKGNGIDNSEERIISMSSTIPSMGRGVSIGQIATMKRTYAIEDVQQFATIVQDMNQLHTSLDWNQALEDNPSLNVNRKAGLIRFFDNDDDDGGGDGNSKSTIPLVHGMLVGSIFSSMFSIIAPGCIYMNQSLDFVGPVFINEIVVGKIEIERMRKWRKGGVVVQCITQVSKQYYVDEKDEKERQEEEAVDDSSSSSPSSSSAVIKGTANVWLPDGSAK
jgi:acyl dehydratase